MISVLQSGETYWIIPSGQKKWTKLLVTNLVVWQLLSGFCLTPPMLCDCDIEGKFRHCCVFQNGSAERQSSECFCTSSCGTQNEWGCKPCRSRTTIYDDALLEGIVYGEGVNTRAGSGWKNVVDRNSFRDTIRSSPSNSIPKYQLH